MMRLLTISLLWALLLAAVPAQAQTWPNEPAGFNTVLDCNFNNALCDGKLVDPYNTSGLNASPPSAHTLNVVSDSSAPISPSSVIKSSLCAGCFNGGTDLSYNFGTTREMYIGMMWRTNPGFQGRTVGNKMFFARGPGYGNITGYNGVFLFGNSSLSGGAAPMIFAHNTGNGLNNNHACAFALGEACYPNAGNGQLIVGAWTKLEAYIKSSTTNTSQDGIVRWWINGVPAGNYTNLNYAPAGLNNWGWSETWDGSICCTFATVEWDHFIDHLYISTGSGGGGITPPPPPPPPSTLPPLGVTGLRFGS